MTTPTATRADSLDQLNRAVLDAGPDHRGRLVGWEFDGHTLATAFSIGLDCPADEWPTVLEHAVAAALDHHHAPRRSGPIVAYTLRAETTDPTPRTVAITADASGAVRCAWNDARDDTDPTGPLVDLVQHIARTTGARYLRVPTVPITTPEGNAVV
ncbi:hypothetical protein [Nocardia farcinica]|uniref:hypothetical protein n=1 Tax=Nocardia farcinica TaxID=37329 RepID=UPI001E45BA64|nr:hypothetical protein [Nocardia farcinica]UEX21174.1 hypothetical protein LMJ57_19430 [Nocardia farcinica]